jgi:hypothetical protein
MGTPYSGIYDLFTMLVNDYKLVSLFEISPERFEQYLGGWLTFAIAEFTSCKTSLERSTGGFVATLSIVEQTILAELMVVFWLQKEVQDVNQMNLKLQDRDFKTYPEAQNLKEKSAYLAVVRERVSQKMNTYAWGNWTD